MKILTEPKVYLLSRPQFFDSNFAKFLTDNGLDYAMLDRSKGADPERLVEMVTRLCYQAFKSGRESSMFHLNLLNQSHGSTIEHANWTLLMAGVSRSFSHELVRHRAGWAYSQLSQRYVDESDVNFVMPPSVQELGETARDYWVEGMEVALARYSGMMEFLNVAIRMNRHDLSMRDARKKAREAARSLLPNATETHIAATANARAWRHFFEMRTDRFADAEMRRVAYACYVALRDEAPFIFGDFKEEMVDGSPELTTPYSKV